VGPDDLEPAAVLPFGHLREPLDAARAADAVLWTGTEDEKVAALELGVADVFRVVRHPGPLQPGVPGVEAPPPGTRVVAVTGIARPQPFVDALRADGYDVAGTVRFRDHHRFDAADLARVRAAVDAAGAAGAVTTEKDWMRLLPFRPLGFPVAWRGITARIEPFAPFAGWLRSRIGAPPGTRESAA